MKHILIYFVIIIIMYACLDISTNINSSTKTSNDDSIAKVAAEKTPDSTGKMADNYFNNIDWTAYKKVYLLESNNKTIQIIGITKKDHEELQYKLYFDNSTCKGEFGGIAKINKNIKQYIKVNNQKLKAYEFIDKVNKDFIIIMNENYVQIKINEKDTDCFPFEDVMMSNE